MIWVCEMREGPASVVAILTGKNPDGAFVLVKTARTTLSYSPIVFVLVTRSNIRFGDRCSTEKQLFLPLRYL